MSAEAALNLRWQRSLTGQSRVYGTIEFGGKTYVSSYGYELEDGSLKKYQVNDGSFFTQLGKKFGEGSIAHNYSFYLQNGSNYDMASPLFVEELTGYKFNSATIRIAPDGGGVMTAYSVGSN